MREYNPCIGCEYYNKPYWSVVSPCKNYTKYHNMNGHTTNTTETRLLNDYLNHSYQESLNNLIIDDLVEDFKAHTALNLTNNDVYGNDSIIVSGYVQGNTLEL